MEYKNPFEISGFDIGLEKLAAGYVVKEADYRLPEDPAQWNASIQDALQNQLPGVFDVGGNPHIVYKNTDWGEKCALGSVSMAVGDELLIFPVVIRYGHLAPFDMVYIHGTDKWIHTSEENMRSFESANRNSVLGEVTTNRIVGDNEYEDRWEYLKAPRGFSYRGARLNLIGDKLSSYPIKELASTMEYMREHPDRILHTSKQAQRLFKIAHARTVAIMEEFSSDPKIGSMLEIPTDEQASNFKLAMSELGAPPEFAPQIPKPAQEAIEEQAEEKEEDLNSGAFEKAAHLFFDVAYIKKAGLNHYTAKFGRRGFDGVFSVSGDIDKIAQYVAMGDRKEAEKILDAVDEAKELFAVDETVSGSKGPIEDLGNRALVEDIDRIHAFGVYTVLTETGDQAVGYVIPIVDWDGKQTPFKLFRNDELWGVESDIHGKVSSKVVSMPNGVLKPGRIGAFVFDEGGRGMAFPPIEIKSVILSNGSTVIRGIDQGSHEQVNIVMSNKVPQLMPMTQKMAPNDFIIGHKNVFMPTGVKFVPLPEVVTKIASKEEAASIIDMKIATAVDKSVYIDKYDNGFRVRIAHELMPYPRAISKLMKEASIERYDGMRTLSAKEAEFALASGGAMMPDLAVSALKEGSNSSYNVPALNTETLECKIAAAQLANCLELPSRMKAAALELRPSVIDVLNVVTIAPTLKKHAEALIGDIFDTSVLPKTASVKGAKFDERPSLDDMFELGFMDDQSMIYYTDKIQDLEELEDLLCKILITTRIASLGVEEDSAQNALYGVSELKNALKRLSFRVNRTD